MRHLFIATVLLSTVTLTSSASAHRWCWNCNQDNTFGWQLMTPDERKAHQAKIQGFSDYSACKEYIDQHHKQMEARAKEKGFDMPRRHNQLPCDEMREQGILK